MRKNYIQWQKTQERDLCLRLDLEMIRDCSYYNLSILNSIHYLKQLSLGFSSTKVLNPFDSGI